LACARKSTAVLARFVEARRVADAVRLGGVFAADRDRARAAAAERFEAAGRAVLAVFAIVESSWMPTSAVGSVRVPG